MLIGCNILIEIICFTSTNGNTVMTFLYDQNTGEFIQEGYVTGTRTSKNSAELVIMIVI